MAPQKQCTKDWLGKDVENTIEHGFRVRRNNVATFAETPSNRIDKPKEHGPTCTHHVCFADVGCNIPSMDAANPDDIPANEEEGDSCKDEVTPLIGRSNESTD